MTHGGSFYKKESKLMNTEDVIRTMRVLLDQSMLHNTELMEELGKVESLRGEERMAFNDTRVTLESRIAVGQQRIDALVSTINEVRGSTKPNTKKSGRRGGGVEQADDVVPVRRKEQDTPVVVQSRLVKPDRGLFTQTALQWDPPTSPGRKRSTSSRIPAP